MFFTNFDYVLFRYFNSLAGLNPFADAVFIFLAVWLIYIFAVLVIVYWFRGPKHGRAGVLLAAASLVVSRLMLVPLIRFFWYRTRPFIDYHVTELIPKGPEASFPSGHATAMFAVASAIYMYDKRAGIFLLVLAGLTAVSRVIVGVHYPSDILFGAILGIAVSWGLERLLARRLKPWTKAVSNFTDRLFKTGINW